MTATISLAGQCARGAQKSPACEGPSSATDHLLIDTQSEHVGSGPNPPDDHGCGDAHGTCVVGDPSSGQATLHSVPIDGALGRTPDDRQPEARPSSVTNSRSLRVADPTAPPAPAIPSAMPISLSPMLADPLLALAADVLDDLERVRIANENRLRQLTRDETDTDGEERGFGLTLDHPDVARLAALVEALAKAEHDAELQLKRTLRRHPLGAWVKQAHGVGEKQAARLLASIGDPYWNTLYDRPRTVSELWAYCGYHVLRTGQRDPDAQGLRAGSAQTPAGQKQPGTQAVRASGAQLRTGHSLGDTPASPAGSVNLPVDHGICDAHGRSVGGNGGNPDQIGDEAHKYFVGVAARRARRQQANWSAAARMRAHLVAVSIIKAGGPYREVYDAARAKYADATHKVECKQCGPAGKPALPGSPLSAGHQHARGLRAVAKEVLKDLWREARRLHDLHDGQDQPETHG